MKKFVFAAALGVLAMPAMAHTGHGDTSGFAHGMLHPFAGADHMLAMLAVGLWSGFALPHRFWAGAAVFLAAMAAGAGLSWAGVIIPMVEVWISLSVIVFGVLTLMAHPDQSRLVSGMSLVAIGGFAAFHGHAHATEAAGSALGYLAGFLSATAALHLVGIGVARAIATGRAARVAQSLLGAGIAIGGFTLLAG